jgi:hypothetical protein
MSNIRVLIWHFYKPLLVCNMVFSLVCIYDLAKIGFWLFGFTVLIKIAGYLVTMLYKYYFSFKTNIYYMNAGYSLKKMYSYIFTFDFIIYLLMVACFYTIKYGFAYFKG